MSLCSVVKTLIVSGAQGTKGQGHLLSCSGQLKIYLKYLDAMFLFYAMQTHAVCVVNVQCSAINNANIGLMELMGGHWTSGHIVIISLAPSFDFFCRAASSS